MSNDGCDGFPLSCRDGAVLQRMATRLASFTAGRTSCLGEVYRSGSAELHIETTETTDIVLFFCIVHFLKKQQRCDVYRRSPV